MSEQNCKQPQEQLHCNDDLFFLYQKEIHGLEAFRCPVGFMTYKIDADHLHIVDVFVHPDFRNQGIAFDMGFAVQEIGRKAGCKNILGQVDCRAKAPDLSLISFIRMGMKILRAENDVIYLVKRLIDG